MSFEIGEELWTELISGRNTKANLIGAGQIHPNSWSAFSFELGNQNSTGDPPGTVCWMTISTSKASEWTLLRKGSSAGRASYPKPYGLLKSIYLHWGG